MVERLSQHLVTAASPYVDQMLIENGFDTLNTQDLHRIIVQDDDEDYQREMEELQKKLKKLEEEKKRKKEAAEAE